MIAEAYRIRAVAFETPAEAAEVEQQESGQKHNDGEDSTADSSNALIATQPRKNDGALEFGRRRVGDSASERFTLRNRYGHIR